MHSTWYLDDVVGVDVEWFKAGECEEDMLVASDRGVRANRSRRVVLCKIAISAREWLGEAQGK